MRKLTFLFMGVLLALSMLLPCVAEEAEIVTEIVTDVLEEAPLEETPAVDEAPVVDAPTEDVPAEEADEWDNFKDKITDSATWTMIGAALATILATVGTVKSKFDGIASLVKNKADETAVKGALKDLENDLKKAYNSNHKEISDTLKRYEEALANTEANEQRLYAILTLFMTNCKISESAKAEILNILSNVKKYEGNISEFVAQAQEAIDEAVKEKEGETPPTPNLDKMLNEDYMDLG